MATGYSSGSALRPVVSWHHCMAPLPSLHLLLGYRYDYAIHGSPYTSAHVLIENTLAQHKMAKNSHMALCCQNRVSKGTNQRDGLHYSACTSVHSALVTLLKKKNLELVNCSRKMCHNEGIMWKEQTRKPHPNHKP